jgi:iron(III) transport system substrate-binding protein
MERAAVTRREPAGDFCLSIASVRLPLLWTMSIVFIAAVLVPFPVHGDVEPLLAELNRKAAEERLRILTEGARKERILSFYGSAPVSNSQDVIRAFNKQYPYIEVRYTRLGAPSLVSRLSTEYQAGLNNADLVSIRGTLFPELIDKRIIARYTSPMAGVMRPGFADKEGYVSSLYSTGYAFIYNTRNVKAGEVPRSFEDLLHPRWKRRLVMDREEYDIFAGMIGILGEPKAAALLKRLVEEQGLVFKRGHTLISQLIAAGEHDLFVDGYVQNAVQLKAAQAPVELAFTNPTIVKPPSALGIAAKAPHPHAAALLTDFYLSKEAQEILAQKLGYWTVHKEVRWLQESPGELHIVPQLEWGRKYNQLVENFRKIIGP